MGDGPVLPRSPRRGGCGRTVRRFVLPVLGGDGLALPLPPRRLEDLVPAGGRGRSCRRCDARRPHVRPEREGARPVLRQALRGAGRGPGAAAAAVVAAAPRSGLPRRARADVSRRGPLFAMSRLSWAYLS